MSFPPPVFVHGLTVCMVKFKVVGPSTLTPARVSAQSVAEADRFAFPPAMLEKVYVPLPLVVKLWPAFGPSRNRIVMPLTRTLVPVTVTDPLSDAACGAGGGVGAGTGDGEGLGVDDGLVGESPPQPTNTRHASTASSFKAMLLSTAPHGRRA